MLSACLGSIAIAFLLWFVNGGRLNESLDATALVASILALGAVWLMAIYILGLFWGSVDPEIPKKNWHFLETIAFFFLLVFAPMGGFREFSGV